MRSLTDLDGKVAVVTGGLSGIGQAAVVALAECGVDIVSVDVLEEMEADQARRVENLGRRYLYAKCDVSDSACVRRLADSVKTEFGRVDILFNNAASATLSRVEEMTDEQWDTTIAVSLRGTFLCSREIGQMMIEQGGGSIVNMASIAGIVGLPRGSAHHAAAKGGVMSFTRTLAVEWAKYGIRVNAIAPGQINTEPLRRIMQQPEQARQILSGIPCGRVGEPEDIASAVVFLAGDSCAFMNGHTMVIDGGASIS